jgi:MaoC dehydratase-like protein
MSSIEFPVEAGHIMMFARAVGDPNPIYSDAAYAATTEVGHVVAPPTFVQSSAQGSANPGSARGRSPPVYSVRRGVGEAEPVSTPSSISSTTGPSGLARC